MLKRIYIGNLKKSNPINTFISYLNWLESKDFFCYSYRDKELNNIVNFDSFFLKVDEDILKYSKLGNGIGIYLFVNKTNLQNKSDLENVYYAGSSVNLRSRIRDHLKEGKTDLSKDIKSDVFEFDLYILLLNKSRSSDIRRLELELVKSLIPDKSSKSSLNSPLSEVGEGTLYNKRFPPISCNTDTLSTKISKRVLSIYSCGFCKDSGNYFKLRKFKSIAAASDYYSLSQKSIRSSIKLGSLPYNFKLKGLGLPLKCKGILESIYFFELGNSRFGRPFICFTEANLFIGYFNSVSSVASFLGLDASEVGTKILAEDCINNNLSKSGVSVASSLWLSKHHNVLVKLYKMNLDTSFSKSDINLIEGVREDKSTYFSFDPKIKKILNRFSNITSMCEFYDVSRRKVVRSLSKKSVVKCSVLFEDKSLKVVNVIFFKELR